MPKGERGSARPYLRGEIWWIKYKVPGEEKPRFESSKSKNKNDAIRLLNKRRKEIDDRQVTATDASVADLLRLYLADQRKQKRSSYQFRRRLRAASPRARIRQVKAARLRPRWSIRSSSRSGRRNSECLDQPISRGFAPKRTAWAG